MEFRTRDDIDQIPIHEIYDFAKDLLEAVLKPGGVVTWKDKAEVNDA